MKSVRRSLAWGLLDNYIGIALQVVATVIIARLLTPNEIGIYSVAAVLGAMAMQFRDFGMAEYLIQEKDLSDQKIRAAFGVNVLLSWSMAVLFLSASWSVADFYRQPGVGQVMRVQALSFLLVPFGGITMAYFRREMEYRPLFVAGIASSCTTFVVGVGGSLMGLSYMALAWSSLLSLAITVAVSVAYRPKHFPRWPGLRGIGEVVAFSKHAMGIYFFGQLGKGAPEAIIGRALDVASVAYFSRANGLVELFNRSVLRAAINICLPYFAKEEREGKTAAGGYMKATTLLTGVGWPFFACTALLAFSAIRLLYGDQWMLAVPLAQVLCIVAVLELPYWLATEVMIAAGRIDKSHALQAKVQCLRVLGVFLVIPFGLIGAGLGLCLAAVVGAWLAQRALREIIDLRFADLCEACKPSLMVTLAAALPPGLASLLVTQSNDNYLFVLLACGSASIVAWLLALRGFEHPFWHELELVAKSLLRRLSSRRGRAQ